MRKFLERQTHSRRNNLTSTISIKVVKNPPSGKTPDPDGFTGEFHNTKHLRKNNTNST